MPVLREGGMIGHIAVEPEPAEPPVGQIEGDVLAQAPLGADTEAVADDHHPDHQLRINRRPSQRAVERRELAAQFRQVDKAVDRPQQMIPRHMCIERRTSRGPGNQYSIASKPRRFGAHPKFGNIFRHGQSGWLPGYPGGRDVACALNLFLQHYSYVPPYSCWCPLWSTQNHAGSQPMKG